MGLKDLFIVKPNNGEVEKTNSGQQSFNNKFPQGVNRIKTAMTSHTIPQSITPNDPSCEPHLSKIMGMYEKGFDNMNQDGYDFYEFYKAVVANGIDNQLVYNMGLTMASSVDKSVTKQSLLEQSQYYITEINKVHSHYESEGNTKSQEIVKIKNQEESTLRSEIDNIKSEIIRLNNLKTQKEGELTSIDSKYTPEITEISCKIMANNMAKESIVGSLSKVVDGIKKYL